jgi:hypothetical protein
MMIEVPSVFVVSLRSNSLRSLGVAQQVSLFAIVLLALGVHWLVASANGYSVKPNQS